MGVRLPFSSIFTVSTSMVELSSGGLTIDGSAITFAGLFSVLKARHSPRTSRIVAKRRIAVSAKLVMYIRMYRMDLKSCIPPTVDSKEFKGTRNWYQVTDCVVPLGSLTCEVTLSLIKFVPTTMVCG